MDTPAVVTALAVRLSALGWVSELFVGGSAATGDYVPGVSDLDLVALVVGELDDDRRALIVSLHRELDATLAAGSDLGCVYVETGRLSDPAARHPTWTHGGIVDRPLSGIARAELVLHGFAVLGRAPQVVLAPVSGDDIRRAAGEELTGYWAMAVRRPWWWLSPTIADLGLTSMARGRHAVATGTLLTKSEAIEVARVPEWLRDDLRARRQGTDTRSPRLRTAWIAWRDARATTAAARR